MSTVYGLYRMEPEERRRAAARFTGKRVRLVLRNPPRSVYGRVSGTNGRSAGG